MRVFNLRRVVANGTLEKCFVQYVQYSLVCAPSSTRGITQIFGRRRSGHRGRSGRAVARYGLPLHRTVNLLAQEGTRYCISPHLISFHHRVHILFMFH
jgi:hypothetical protein